MEVQPGLGENDCPLLAPYGLAETEIELIFKPKQKLRYDIWPPLLLTLVSSHFFLVSFMVAIAALGRLWLHSCDVLSFAISWDTSHPYPFISTITLLFTKMSVLRHHLNLNRELKQG